MTNSEIKKAPAGQGEGETENPFHYQEEGVTMTSIVHHTPSLVESFDPEIRVGKYTVFPADNTVWVHTPIGALSFTPEQACAVAAALQAVAVHVMEQQPREIRRSTEPGAPQFEAVI